MKLELNVYKNKEIEKTYTAETYDLMFGTVEDFIEAIDLDRLSDGNDSELISAAGSLVTKGLGQIKPLLLDVFDGLTEEELKRTKVKDLIGIVIEIIKYSIAEINGVGTRKNA